MGAMDVADRPRCSLRSASGHFETHLCEAYWMLGPFAFDYPMPGLEKCWDTNHGILPQ